MIAFRCEDVEYAIDKLSLLVEVIQIASNYSSLAIDIVRTEQFSGTLNIRTRAETW